MEYLTLESAVPFAAALAVGLVVGILLRGVFASRRLAETEDEWQLKVDNVSRVRDRQTAEIETLRAGIETLQGTVRRKEHAIAKAGTEIESANERANGLRKDIHTLRAEREEFKSKVANFQARLTHVRTQAEELENEFLKSMDFYKGELAKSFEKRKLLEAKIEDAEAEHESFSNLLTASRTEHDSVSKMLASTKARLNHLDSLEQDVIRLEAENAALKHDTTRLQSEKEILQRDVAELDELKVQNKELAHCLESMESSRRQYEEDASRYRDRAGESEQQSETLRLRLDEVEKEFSNIKNQQRDALHEVRKEAAEQVLKNTPAANEQVDDLQEIIGIGKVFESALHELGIVSFRQIANFDVNDIARVNSALKECRGRMEQDDWIGQARELHFKKYG